MVRNHAEAQSKDQANDNVERQNHRNVALPKSRLFGYLVHIG